MTIIIGDACDSQSTQTETEFGLLWWLCVFCRDLKWSENNQGRKKGGTTKNNF